jgi:hypothetical protein
MKNKINVNDKKSRFKCLCKNLIPFKAMGLK